MSDRSLFIRLLAKWMNSHTFLFPQTTYKFTRVHLTSYTHTLNSQPLPDRNEDIGVEERVYSKAGTKVSR